MNRYWISTAAVIAVALACLFAGQRAPAQANKPWPEDEPAWEYKVVMRHDVIEKFAKTKKTDEVEGMRDALTQSLNPLGAEGWQLVTAADGEFIFKRKLTAAARAGKR